MSCYPGHPGRGPPPHPRFLSLPDADGPMDASSGGFDPVETPVDADLIDVTVVGDAAFAVGEDGVVLGRKGGDWAVRSEGEWPSRTGANPLDPPALTAVAATADGRRVWFAGEDGSVGYLDPKRDTALDLTHQTAETATFTALGVTGETGGERLVLADSEGRVVEALVNGTTATFAPPVRVGDGAEIPDIETGADGAVLGCDADGNVIRRGPGADAWTVHDVTDRRLTGVAIGEDELLLSTAAGDVLSHDLSVGETYVERTDAEGFSDVAARREATARHGDGAGLDAGEVVAVGPAAVAERSLTGWTVDGPATLDAYAVACGPRDVAVGADGAVLER